MADIIEKQFRAGAAVTASLMVIELNAQIIAERIESVVVKLWITSPSHLTRAGIYGTFAPADLVCAQAL